MLKIKRTYVRKIKQNKHDEQDLRVAVAEYLKYQYPDIIYRFDIADLKLNIQQAVRLNKINNSGHPDLTIYEVRKPYAGLILELKKDHDQLYDHYGNLRQNKHILSQKQVLDILTKKGYKALFACGFDETVKIINEYLN